MGQLRSIFRFSVCSPLAICNKRVTVILVALACVHHARAITVPSTPPSGAVTVDPSLVSVSIEFFAFPGYTEITGTNYCLDNLASLRGAQPAVRIGGTTQ